MKSKLIVMAVVCMFLGLAESRADTPEIEFLYSDTASGLVKVRSEAELPQDKANVHVRIYTACNKTWFWGAIAKITGEKDLACTKTYMSYTEYLSQKTNRPPTRL